MELIVISNQVAVTNEAIIINELFQSGLKRFHLRKPYWNEVQIIDLLMHVDPEFRSYIILHQHHHIAAGFNIKRLHYTEKERLNTQGEQLTHLSQQGYTLSTSVHHLSALYEVGAFSYVFFGPVFNSISKADYKSTLSEDFYLDKTGIGSKVIALGGIDENNLDKVKKKNFDGAAVLGALWQRPHEAVQTFDKLKILTNNTNDD